MGSSPPISIAAIAPPAWPHYRLIDSGDYEKLEQFGPYTLWRPEPQAVWSPSLPTTEWEKRAQARFRREKGSQEKGEWITQPGLPFAWAMPYALQGHTLQFKISLSAFKHVGIFPEQADNWEYIYQQCSRIAQCRVLNLFAYTGGASLAARAAGAEVTHLDSVKQVVSWARDNMEASNLSDIRWMVEDAMKYAKREQRRGKHYHGIIMDPPAYGRGPEGEKWLLEEHLSELMAVCASLLHPSQHFFVISLYSLGFSALITHNLVQQHFPTSTHRSFGELYIPDEYGKNLPLGTFYRFHA